MLIGISKYIYAAMLMLIIGSCRYDTSNKDKQEEKNLQEIVAEINRVDDSLQKIKDTVIAHTDTISLTAVGDMMLGTGFPKEYLPPLDGKDLLLPVAKYLKGNIVFGNVEGCFADTGISRKCSDSSGKNCYAFRMPLRYASYFSEAGFNLVSLANNHINDFGKSGRQSTMEVLDSLHINFGGLKAHPVALFTIGNKIIAFTAFSPNTHTLPILNTPRAQQIIQDLKAKADIVIVSLHGGAEGDSCQHVTRQPEYFYGEPRGNVYQFAHAAIDAGADVIIGQGPHVTRAVELYKQKIIAYSLGNFCTYGRFALDSANGIAPILQIKILNNGNFARAKVISIRQPPPGGPVVDKENRAFDYLKRLTQEDFPESRLIFHEDNTINVP